MTKTERIKWLTAIGKLERFYRAVVEGRKPKYFSCPLCDVPIDCDECLWFRFEGDNCNSPIYKRTSHNIPWAKSSLKRLARWRARLEKEK